MKRMAFVLLLSALLLSGCGGTPPPVPDYAPKIQLYRIIVSGSEHVDVSAAECIWSNPYAEPPRQLDCYGAGEYRWNNFFQQWVFTYSTPVFSGQAYSWSIVKAEP